MPTYSAPTSYNLAAYVANLMNPSGQKVWQVIGDSINEPANTKTLFRVNFGLPFAWNGCFQPSYSTIINGYGNSQSGNRTALSNVIPGGTAGHATGSSSIWPVQWIESTYSADPGGSNLGDNILLLEGNLASAPPLESLMPHLSAPFLRDETYQVNARGIVYTLSDSLSGNLNPTGFRATSGGSLSSAVATGTAVTKSGSPPAYQYGDVSCGTAVVSPSTTHYQNPAFQWKFGAGVYSVGNNKAVLLGTRYLNANPNGVLYNAPIAISGWTHADHANTSKITDAAIVAYWNIVGWPTHMWLWLGQNAAGSDYTNLSAGSITSYMTGMNSVIDRYEALFTANSKPLPRWCMISQYATSNGSAVSYGFNFFDNMAKAHLQIALARGGRYSTLNLYRCLGGESLQRIAYNCKHFAFNDTADRVHPHQYGGSFFTMGCTKEIIRAVQEEGTNYDRRFR